jgi:hypothetical protein
LPCRFWRKFDFVVITFREKKQWLYDIMAGAPVVTK